MFMKNKESSKLKIAFVSSSGGHWEELMCLGKIVEEHNSFYITESGGQAGEIVDQTIYTVPQINRKQKGFLINFIKLFIKAVKIFKSEKPDVVISTGALVSFPFCLMGKMRGSKIIYIESFARVYDKSLTGKLVYPFADLFIVQWESLLECYPKAVYAGSIF